VEQSGAQDLVRDGGKRLRVHPLDAPVGVQEAAPGGAGARIRFQVLHHDADRVVGHFRVWIEKEHEPTDRMPKSEIVASGEAEIFVRLNKANSWKFGTENLFASVIRSVVDYNDFERDLTHMLVDAG
jgi:hypothetical protein